MLYLSLGSNLGDRERNIRSAIALIGERVGKVVRCSSLHYTKPWGFKSDNEFINAAVAVECSLSPREVLLATQAIERELGRTEKSQPANTEKSQPNSTDLPQYHDREIDIDILLYDHWRINAPDLHIPHPLMHERDFVMRPLREVYEEQ